MSPIAWKNSVDVSADSKQTAGLCEEPGRCEFVLAALEALLQPDVPEPAFDRGQRLIIAVLEVASHERWIEVAYVLQTKRNRGVIKPPLPVAAAILSRGHWNNILFLPILHLHVLATILGIARNLGWSRRCEVKRIVQDQVERDPSLHFSSKGTLVATHKRLTGATDCDGALWRDCSWGRRGTAND